MMQPDIKNHCSHAHIHHPFVDTIKAIYSCPTFVPLTSHDCDRLEEAAGEVSALYAELEAGLFQCSLRKALAMDEVHPNTPPPITSSCVEDTFFVAQVLVVLQYHLLRSIVTVAAEVSIIVKCQLSLLMDKVHPNTPPPVTFSCVEDAFFVAQVCVHGVHVGASLSFIICVIIAVVMILRPAVIVSCNLDIITTVSLCRQHNTPPPVVSSCIADTFFVAQV